jgi:hypothetical protein
VVSLPSVRDGHFGFVGRVDVREIDLDRLHVLFDGRSRLRIGIHIFLDR